MTLAVHRWNRPTLLARLHATDALDALAETDPSSSARERLRLLSVSDRFEAGALSDEDAVEAFDAIRAAALDVAAAGVGASGVSAGGVRAGGVRAGGVRAGGAVGVGVRVRRP